MPTVASALRKADLLLRQAGRESPERDSRLLLSEASGRDLSFLLAHPEFEIKPEDLNRFELWIRQRAEGKPIAYLTGHQEFYGRDFVVSPAVLIPRPETEMLIEQALRILAPARQEERRGASRANLDTSLLPSPIWIADVGTGSGCIAVTLALEIPWARILATDISAAALAVARKNARIHRVSHRVQFHHADLLPSGAARLDVIVSNPPYVAREDPSLAAEVRDHEPQEALFAGKNGLETYARLVPEALCRLKAGGWLILELGYHSEEKVRSLFDPSQWRSVETFPDLQGIPRCLVARREGDTDNAEDTEIRGQTP
ncbi:MAG TPA: peptide chain release factor N(5)-glutamine methyltransferase [Acidobacteriota bacterium]|jgi:release factor glutamine methyltransferase